jgi:hypothetical protein
MVQMDCDGDGGSLRRRQAQGYEWLATMLQSARVQLQHHWTALRLGSMDHGAYPFEVIDIESTDGVFPCHGSAQQLCR